MSPIGIPQAFSEHQAEIERKIHQVWMPHAGQVPIAAAFLIYWQVGVFVQCGRKFGKTELGIYLLYMFALMFPGSECFYIADEKDHAREICWDNGRLPRFLTSIRKNPGESDEDFNERKRMGKIFHEEWIEGINNTTMTIRFKNGSIIRVDGAKNHSSADGLSPTFVVYDEFKNHEPKFDTAMRPNLMALRGRILIIGTPPDNEENYYCETAEEFKHKKGHKFFRRPCYFNPYVYPGGSKDPYLLEEEKAYRRKGEWHVFAREYLAKITPDEKRRIFPMLRDEEHRAKYNDMLLNIKRYIKDWDFFASYDPASTSVFGVLLVAIHRNTKAVWLLDEIYETEQMKMTSKQIYGRALIKRTAIQPWLDDWQEIYDHAAAWFQTEVQLEFDKALNPCTKDMKNKEAKLSVIKDAMLNGRFLVSDRCKKTWWELENYQKDDKGKIPKKNDHNIDNIRYILNAAHYDSVPRENLPKDFFSSHRRFHTPESDRANDAMESLFNGEIDDYDYDNIVNG